jgi:hypothetical protein
MATVYSKPTQIQEKNIIIRERALTVEKKSVPQGLGCTPALWDSLWLDQHQRPPLDRHQWLMPVILATQEAEIRNTVVQIQPRQIVHETLSQKKPITKKKKRLVEWSGSRYRP